MSFPSNPRVLKLGAKSPEVQKLQEGLAALGIHPGSADGAFGGKTEDAVEAFQLKVDLLPDGVFGPGSLTAWNALCTSKGLTQYVFDAAAPAADPLDLDTKVGWASVPADPLAGGYKNLTLRVDVAVAYKAMYDEVHALGGVISTAGGKRSLDSGAGPARSKTSFHYLGRAFDQATGYCMQNPAKDRFIAVRDGDARTFTIWCKTDNPAVPSVTLKACWCRTLKNASGKKYTQLSYEDWTGQAFNFTEIAKKHGFERIAGRKFFFAGGSFDGAETWHFQWESGLLQGKTTYGSELLKVYSLAECKKFAYWDEVKDGMYGEDWG